MKLAFLFNPETVGDAVLVLVYDVGRQAGWRVDVGHAYCRLPAVCPAGAAG